MDAIKHAISKETIVSKKLVAKAVTKTNLTSPIPKPFVK